MSDSQEITAPPPSVQVAWSVPFPFAQFAPPQSMRAIDWCRAHLTDDRGRPYDHRAYPHLGAPHGPFDAFDDPAIRVIWLQFASRLGKTYFGQSCQCYTAATNPRPMMFASAAEKNAVEVVSRLYAILIRSRPLRGQVRPEHRRTQDRVDLARCRIWVSWARSVSTLADKDVAVGHANEVDKWEHESTSKEADPLPLFQDRHKNIPNHKQIIESTPTVKGRSRIERGRLAADNRQYYVPCPHCGVYQTLSRGEADAPHGLRWEKNMAGRSDKIIAYNTAHYVCPHCLGKIVDHHRGPMMRAGVWVPEGCGVDHAKAARAAADWPGARAMRRERERYTQVDYLTGVPTRAGVESSFLLSSLYALSCSWGQIAAAFVGSLGRPQDLRNYINQWEAKTWELTASRNTWQQIGERLARPGQLGVCPLETSLLTAAVDQQKDHYKFLVLAWAPEGRCHVLDYGSCDELADFERDVLSHEYPHADGKAPLRIRMALGDSGDSPKRVYDFAQRHRQNFLVCKGASTPLGSEYRRARLGKETAAPGLTIIHIDSRHTQDYVEQVLHTLTPDDPGGLTLPCGNYLAHQDLLEELLNEAVSTELDKRGYEKELWNRVNHDQPNDYRDTLRYAYVARLLATRGGPIPQRTPQATTRAATTPLDPHGRPYLISDRVRKAPESPSHRR